MTSTQSKKLKPIALVGLPGSGKTTVGRHLARTNGVKFIDTDHLIEERIGCSIRDFFVNEGEAAFRKIEASIIAEIGLQGDCVLSTGGGVVLNESNRLILRSQFCCIYLRAKPQELFRRLRNDRKLPLLQVSDPMQVLVGLFNVRDPLYQEVSQITVDTSHSSVASLIEKISQELLNLTETGGDPMLAVQGKVKLPGFPGNPLV
jgi:shikimate kinase